MTRIDKRNLSVNLCGFALVCIGAFLTYSGTKESGVPIALVGVLVMGVSVLLMRRETRRK